MKTVGIVVASFMFGMLAGNACTKKVESTPAPVNSQITDAVTQAAQPAEVLDAGLVDAGVEPMTVKQDVEPSPKEVTPTVETK